MKARLVRHEKFILRKRFTIEVIVHEVINSNKYPEGLKWSLICIDRISGKKVLMDNHHPKQAHYHIDEIEMPYNFIDLDLLIFDFRKLVTEHMGVQL